MAAKRFDASEMGNIRAGRVRQYFAIPAEGGLPEFVVDLAGEQPVPVCLLLDRPRRASLSEEMWRDFVVHRFVFQSRLKPENVFTKDFVP